MGTSSVAGSPVTSSATTRRSFAAPRPSGVRAFARGFSLIELLIVITVAMLLTGMLLPAMKRLRENVNRVVCSSNMRQFGIGVSMFASDNLDALPKSAVLDSPLWHPEELMASYQQGGIGWDGLGILFQKEYCGAYECFYCPSHKGAHAAFRYADDWDAVGPASTIYTNYHYAGHRDWITGLERRYAKLNTLVLATDGLRTASDFNHRDGMNVLQGDLAVRWRPDLIKVLDLLPDDVDAGDTVARYESIWSQIQNAISAPDGLSAPSSSQ